jgi:hypothetical protein
MQPFDELRGKELARALLESDPFCLAALGACGIEVTTVGERFFNSYQPHEDKASAYLYRTSDGRLEVRSFRDVEGEHKGSRVTLAQLYRDTRAGVIGAIREETDEVNRRTVGGPESAVWIMRLAREAGFVDLPPSQVQPLASSSSDSTRRVYEGADLLDRCRRRYDFDNVNFPAASSFMQDWTGQSESEVASAKRWLVTRGYWIVVSKGQPWQQGLPHGEPTLYRFGKPEENRVRERAARQKHAATDIDRRYQSGQQAAQELREGRSNRAGHLPESYEKWHQQAGGDLHVQQEGVRPNE